MKKIIAIIAFLSIFMLGFGQDTVKKERQIFSSTEFLFCPGNFNIARTGITYKGFYPFVEVNEFAQEYKFKVGLAYDGAIKNTNFRVLGNYGEEFYGFVMVYQNFNIKPVNFQPIFFVDWNLEMSLGLFVPYPLGKYVTLGAWVYKPIKEANVGGFKIGSLRF